MGISGGFVLGLIFLFRRERARGARYGERLRNACDCVVEDAQLSLRERARGFSGPALRQSAHYILHRLLSAALRGIQRAERAIHFILHFNRTRANGHSNGNGNGNGNGAGRRLSLIAEHKRAVALSEEEKTRRREAALSAEF